MDRSEQLEFLKRQLEKAHANNRPRLGGMLINLPDKVVLRRKIYSTKLIELVKTIEEETDELFGNLSDKIVLQNNTVFFSVSFMGELDTLLTDVALNMVETFLTQINIRASRLREQDMHRIIMVLALMIYAECNNKEAKRLEDLVKNMDLIK
ncbi:MAG: hypothetical protein LBD56_00310 [Endomicrobium sp.]|jgi:hypothetical protein|nr:hypothetical protein [Endomicrobium sp.]